MSSKVLDTQVLNKYAERRKMARETRTAKLSPLVKTFQMDFGMSNISANGTTRMEWKYLSPMMITITLVRGQDSNSAIRHMKRGLDIIATCISPSFRAAVSPHTLVPQPDLQGSEDAGPLSGPRGSASPLLTSSSTSVKRSGWFLCDVFLHSLKTWLLPLPCS